MAVKWPGVTHAELARPAGAGWTLHPGRLLSLPSSFNTFILFWVGATLYGAMHTPPLHLFSFPVFLLGDIGRERGAGDIQGFSTGAMDSPCTHRPPTGGSLGLTICGGGAMAGTKGPYTIPAAIPNADPHNLHS